MPGFGTIGSPGQRDIRYSKWADEFKRIKDCILWMLIFALGILACLFWDSLALGPWIGWMIILIVVCIPLIMYVIGPMLKEARKKGRPAATLAIGLPLTGLLVAWALIGYPWIVSLWPPFYRDIQELPVWVLALTLIASLAIKIALGWGIWAMFSELVDPNGPTAPRQATPRETTIYPWQEDTFGGKFIPEFEQPINLPPSISRVHVTSEDGRHTQEVRVPKTDNWRRLAAFVIANHNAGVASDKLGFTEYRARVEKISLNPVVDDDGIILFPGFRTIRDHFLSLGWAHWKNPDAHNQGVVLHEEAIAALRAVANGQVQPRRETPVPQSAGN